MTSSVEGADQVSVGSDDLANAAQSMAENTQTQAASIEELAAQSVTLNELVQKFELK